MIKTGLKTIAAVLLSSMAAMAATTPLYVNHGEINEAPQIDAAAFFNDGIFDIFTSLPFSTLNTVNFTNRGSMFGSPGWRLDYAGPGQRQPMNSFVNTGLMESLDRTGFTVIIGDSGLNQVIGNGSASVSYMLLSATNVTSSGLLTVGTGGLLKVQAKTAKLNRSGVRSGTSPGGQSGNSDFVIGQGTNYINAPEILDNYWGLGINQALVTTRGAPLDLLNTVNGDFQFNVPHPVSPPHEVQRQLLNSNVFNTVIIPTLQTANKYSAFVYTNIINSTSIVIQVAYVSTNLNNGDVRATVLWGPGGSGARVPIVRIGARAFDTVLYRDTENYVYISDDMGTRSNVFLSLNLAQQAGRPVNYRVGTAPPIGWFTGIPSNKPFRFDEDIFNFAWTYSIVTNSYSAYSFLVNRQASDPFLNQFVGLPSRGFFVGNPFTPDFYDPTNRQGRVEIDVTESLDLSRTRIRADQYAQIKSPNVAMDANTTLDSPFISLDIGSATGSVMLDNLIPRTVDRISGQINCYSATWTNQLVEFDFSVDPPSSNVTFINQHIFIVDNGNIEKSVDVTVAQNFITATNITIRDSMFISTGLRLAGENVTLDAEYFEVYDKVNNLGPTNFVGTINLSNLGSVRNFGGTVLGTQPGDPLSTYYNGGLWYSIWHEIDVDEIVNDGSIYAASGPIYLTAPSGNINLGSVVAIGDVYLNFDVLDAGFSSVGAGGYFSASGLNIPGKIHVNITEAINDGGEFQGATLNTWYGTDGFEMLSKPMFGDFHGTAITSFGPAFGEVVHKWAGDDHGLSVEGYQDNAAIGRLTLDGDILSLFTFETVDGNDALYVEYLELRNFATNVNEALDIKPGMKVYFSRANVPINQLNGKFDGRLRYLPISTAGATTAVTLASGQTFVAKNNLLFSSTLDSDRDGIANSQDATPFDEAKITVEYVNEPAPAALISWDAAPRTEYILQYKNDVADAEWQELDRRTTFSDLRRVVVTDPAAEGGHRYYRIIYVP